MLLAFSMLLAGNAQAERRVALVIGNSSYANVRGLANPTNDAIAVAALLKSVGFDSVDMHTDMNGSAMRRALRDFSDKAHGADVALVYFAGHGIEVDGNNYLLPTNAVLERDIDVEDEAISLDRILKILEPATRLRMVILDACRDNPFVRTMRRTSATRSVGRGLARIEPPSSDTLVAFSAKAGSVALDGKGMHSPFTAALLQHIASPGLDLRIAFGRIRDTVLKTTANKQEPFVYGSLGGSTVSLVPPLQETRPVAVAPSTPAPTVDPNALARRDYDYAVQIGTKEAWNSFLANHGAGFYSDLARAQRDKLIAEEART
ncbi:MAG TPA: caspase family protein, partial [Pirellulales bacterium]|nr:caspase family protein [Pirellulales bacterium]